MNDTAGASTASVTGVILAGGAGRRLGHIDKGLAGLNQQPLVEHVLNRLAPQVGRILIIANRNQDSYAAYGHEVIGDCLPDYPGPLVGMYSGLQHLVESRPQALCLFVPVDAPQLPSRLAAGLLEAAADRQLAVVRTADGLQPICCLIGPRHLPDLAQAVQQGERSPSRWLRSQHAAEADFSTDVQAIWSINTTAELEQSQQQLSTQGSAA